MGSLDEIYRITGLVGPNNAKKLYARAVHMCISGESLQQILKVTHGTWTNINQEPQLLTASQRNTE